MYAEAVANKINDDTTSTVESVTITQTVAGWAYVDEIAGVKTTDSSLSSLEKGDKVKVTVADDGTPTFAEDGTTGG